MKKYEVDVIALTCPKSLDFEDVVDFESEEIMQKTLQLSTNEFTQDVEHIYMAGSYEPCYIQGEDGTYTIYLYVANKQEAEDQIKIIEDFYIW